MVTGPKTLIDELRAARADLYAVLDGVRPESLTTPGLLGEWSARELIAHLGYWAGHATELIHAVENGRVDEGDDERPIDEINATVARIARGTDLATVRRREAASVEALIERLETVDPALLDIELPDGATLAEGVRVDGPEHYREHAEELRGVLGQAPHG